MSHPFFAGDTRFPKLSQPWRARIHALKRLTNYCGRQRSQVMRSAAVQGRSLIIHRFLRGIAPPVAPEPIIAADDRLRKQLVADRDFRASLISINVDQV